MWVTLGRSGVAVAIETLLSRRVLRRQQPARRLNSGDPEARRLRSRDRVVERIVARVGEVAARLAAREQEHKPATRCALSVPKDSGPVILFPTREGFDEFAKAAGAGDAAGIRVAITANGGYTVAKGTKCTWLDVGLLGTTKVRVTEGPHLGKIGFIPTEWASGAE